LISMAQLAPGEALVSVDVQYLRMDAVDWRSSLDQPPGQKPAPDVAASLKARSAQSWATPRNPYIRDKFTRRELTALRDK
jgi:hypothetical protein